VATKYPQYGPESSPKADIVIQAEQLHAAIRFDSLYSSAGSLFVKAPTAGLMSDDIGTGFDASANSGPRQRGRSLASTARQFLEPYWKANSSVMNEVLSLGPSRRPPGDFRLRMVARHLVS
jgi:hypothetical protein